MPSHQERIAIAAACNDCESIPRVPNAGSTLELDGRAYQVMHNGLLVDTTSHYGAFNTEVIRRLKGHHEPQEEKVFDRVLEHIPEGGTMLELGSFWAYYSMWFQQRVPGARNLMVEPLETTMACGQHNFERNQMRGEFIQACVGERSLPAVTFTSWDDSRHQIPQVCVDTLMQQRGIDRLNLLHADIQGAELDMLRGARRAFDAARVDYVFISTHTERLHRRCLAFLARRSYRVIASHTMAQSYSVDGLIAAAAPHCGRPGTVTISRKQPGLRERYRLVKGWAGSALSRAA